MFDVQMPQGAALNVSQPKIHIDDKRNEARVEGHRGAGYLEPENSIKAFNKAIELGLDGVEFDVWLTKDGVPVVVHGLPEGVIEFEKNFKEKIGNIDHCELDNYTLNNGEKIPTLAEVLDTCKDKVTLNIEIKEVKEEVIGKVVDLLQERDMFEQITLSSFNHYLRETLTREINSRKIAKTVTFGFLMSIHKPRLPDFDVETRGSDSINLDIRYLENQREECLATIAKAKERQMKVSFWFPMEYTHEANYWDDLLSVGTDTIITNVPIALGDYFIQRQFGL